MPMTDNVRNIGIFAHVDAGKTTLSERLLLTCGQIRSAGAVDAGTAHTDRLAIEKKRGISVKSACAPLFWNNTHIRLIDTPGHADFSSEIERSMWAIDGAVLLISGPDGVQPQTEVLYRTLSKNGIPMILFVNKMDRNVADFEKALSDIKKKLTPRVFDASSDEEIMAAVAEEDEDALLSYMEGEIWPREKLWSAAEKLIQAGRIYPVLSGSALTGKGVDALLTMITTALPAPEKDETAPVSGMVFSVETDSSLGRAAYVRLYSGAIKNRDIVKIRAASESDYTAEARLLESKITQIRAIGASGKGEDIGEMHAGDIALVYGLQNVKTGQVIGQYECLPERIRKNSLKAPLFMTKVSPENPDDFQNLKKALETLSAEDPLLDVSIVQKSIHVRLMGAIQLEILEEELLSRFGIRASFSAPEVIYRETIKQTAVGFCAYTMPKPCWAIIKFEIIPKPRGSGVTFESVISPRDIKYRYQHQVENAIPIAIRQGMLGWQVDDVHIRLIEGGDHEIHTHPLDFIVATPMAFMDGLQRGGSVLLEPILEMEITVDENGAGKIIGEMNAMRGSVLETTADGGKITLLCEAPAAECADFPVRFQRITSGTGSLLSRLKCYREVTNGEIHTCERTSVNPLDTAKYILAARNALASEIFER
ncbi:MAG: TetM/TetW/TetO/TetS family tetracycline resistance ribosomal protection protein [Clostridiales bacterium]|nr:TetM/TetW/TetO/TetS family tetracycline resistance ribosomal protection protein [Clostridiales bacterium]